MMKIRPPKWQLRRACPVCEQAELVLVACPECSHIAVVCAEEGSAFHNVLTVVLDSAVDPESVRCPQCAGPLMSTFKPATSDQIRTAGLEPTDYE